jgi:hypothetical protein
MATSRCRGQLIALSRIAGGACAVLAFGCAEARSDGTHDSPSQQVGASEDAGVASSMRRADDDCYGAPGSEQELALTPRSHPFVEMLARALDGTFTASSATYERLESDITAFRAMKPETASVTTFSPSSAGLFLLVDDPTMAAMENGHYEPWACLDARYSPVNIEYTRLDGLHQNMVVLEFAGVYDELRLVEAYGQLPNVKAELNTLSYIGLPTAMHVARKNGTWTYTFPVTGRTLCAAASNCAPMTLVVFVSESNGDRSFVESIDQGCICSTT